MAEECEHLGRVGGVRSNVAVDKFVRVRQIIFGQRHPPKIKLTPGKSELDLESKGLQRRICSEHNMFGWQGKTSTTNGVFCPRKL
jgi:hypothetical protein